MRKNLCRGLLFSMGVVFSAVGLSEVKPANHIDLLFCDFSRSSTQVCLGKSNSTEHYYLNLPGDAYFRVELQPQPENPPVGSFNRVYIGTRVVQKDSYFVEEKVELVVSSPVVPNPPISYVLTLGDEVSDGEFKVVYTTASLDD